MFEFLKFQKRKHVKAICFDLDNTLCDYGSAEAQAEAHMAQMLAKETGRAVNEVLTEFNGVKNKYLHHTQDPKNFSRALWIEEMLRNMKVKKRIDVKDFEREYWEYLAPHIELFDNTLSTLENLKEKFKLACITDSDGAKDIKMGRIERLGLKKYFDYIIVSEDTGENKPSKKNWELFLEKSGLKAEECMMVGDHPEIDLLSPKEMGFVTVWTKQYMPVDMHFEYVDHEIGDIIELNALSRKYR